MNGAAHRGRQDGQIRHMGHPCAIVQAFDTPGFNLNDHSKKSRVEGLSRPSTLPHANLCDAGTVFHALLALRQGLKRRQSNEREPKRQDSGSQPEDRKSTRLNSSHVRISYAVFCLKKKKKKKHTND